MPPSPTPTTQRPTRVRYAVVAVTVLMAVLLYLDRFCVSFAERFIKEDLALTETQMAWFISLFFWSYALGQVPCGWLGDRFGVRGVLAFYILSWSVFTALIGFAGGVVSLLVMRLGCGLAQAGAFPACGNLLSKWIPLSSRGRASSLVALGGRVGAVIAPILTAYLIVVFVPLSTPALLEPDHLLRPLPLIVKLSQGGASATAANAPVVRVFELLPLEVQRPIVNFGAVVAATQTQADLIGKVIDEYKSRDDVSSATAWSAELKSQENLLQNFEQVATHEAMRATLIAGLNQVLENGEAFRPEDIKALRSVEREALGLLARRDAGHLLTPQQSIRLNRLLMEAVFPTEIGKLYVRGWRPVVILYGLAGVLVAGVFWFYFRNTPAEHPGCNAAERGLIDVGKATEASNALSARVGDGDETADGSATRPTQALTRATQSLPIGVILRSRSLWLSSISQFGTNVGWLFLVTWLARYLIEAHNVPILERSWMAAIPPIAGIAGMFLGGQLTDALTRKIGLRWGRALPMAVTRFFAAAAYLACLWLDSPWAATIAFACVFFSVDLGVSATWAFMQDVGGRNVGSILGWGNMWGNVGAAIAPQLYNLVLGEQPGTDEWNAMFLVCAGMFVMSGLAALGIDATVPIEAGPVDAARRAS
ncbi:MAG: MFS transporter [Planctomycetaceae bacterium]|nr:MFS transporter [Planctomycetaceae bacterium]